MDVIDFREWFKLNYDRDAFKELFEVWLDELEGKT
jgi:hypothetical protein